MAIQFLGKTTLMATSLLIAGQAMASVPKYIWSNTNGFTKIEACDTSYVQSSPFMIAARTDSDKAMAQVVDRDGANKGLLTEFSLVKRGTGSDKDEHTSIIVVGVSQNKGVQSGEGYAARNDEGYLPNEKLLSSSDFVMEIKEDAPAEKIGNSGIKLVGSFFQANRDNDGYVVYTCGSGSKRKSYMSFDVFVAGQEQVVAKVGVNVDETKIFRSILTHTPEGAATVAAEQAPSAKKEDSSQSSSNPSAKKGDSSTVDTSAIKSLTAPNCALSKILTAAKAWVKKNYGNRPSSAGTCAKGVRVSLQKSGVGGISGGMGNAIDFIANLKARGFVDTGIRDPEKAPVGAVIVLSGPKSKQYLKNHVMKKPYGTYVGHVTIKGGDGYYYTDARTAEVAVGWSNGKNVKKVRNVEAIMVPGKTLVSHYVGKCSNM